MSWSRVSFANWSTLSFPSMPQWHGIEQKTNMCAFVVQRTAEVHGVTNARVISVFKLKWLQRRHWVGIDNHIMPNWAHVPIIVQCQSDGHSFSSKDVAVAWQSCEEVAASCHAILKMEIDDCHCSQPLIHFGSVGVDFIMYCLSFTRPIELGLGCLSIDQVCFHSLTILSLCPPALSCGLRTYRYLVVRPNPCRPYKIWYWKLGNKWSLNTKYCQQFTVQDTTK